MSEKNNKNRGLGRGLSALMADVNAAPPRVAEAGPARADQFVAVERIHPNPNQPRRNFSEDALQELAASIKEKGIIQPLIVRAKPDQSGHFEIVAGERRWRAAQIAQLHQVPVLVREFTDTEVLEVAIIENIQRADLNAIDEAAGYRQLMDRFGRTQEQMAEAMGKSRSHIANLLRLLTLPEDVRAHVIEGRLSAGHARALIGHQDASSLARRVVAEGLSVRQVEKLVKTKAGDSAAKTGGSSGSRSTAKDPDTIQIEQELAAHLHMGVSIDHPAGSESGQLVLKYRNLGQLDDLLRLLSGN